jgi:predicted TIM-barrel fold metal-dependent hydrolase
MPYAEGRTFYDADSHIMETRNWMLPYADPGIRERLAPLYLGGAGRMVDDALEAIEGRRASNAAAADAEKNLMTAKGWMALGAFDSAERSRALDLLGFDRQLVFTTFAPTHFWSRGSFDVGNFEADVLYGGTRAHNRAIADFCGNDKRMIGVGFVPLDVPELAIREVDEAIKLGCGAIHIPSIPPRQSSPVHPDYHGFWARLQDAGVPFVLHVGGGGKQLHDAFHNNGKPPVTDFLGGGENIRSKDLMVIHYMPEMFLSCMVLDGLFEEFPRLKGGCIEQGGMWVVPWLRRLDIAQETFKRSEPALKLPMRASDYVRRNLRFTPFSTEPVGWMIENAGEELFLFSSDYPHIEGGRNPIKRFEESMAAISEAKKERFYSGNFADLMGMGT